eukprot:CAMPEP_0170422414 /NCGR_PEP_ID=MMETSP0117_2-20130122/36437_1 /TAXON_ID=400756 /ORGANISM="Durinskia baltica, Strain CSIRO CS-38" /LENGTH=98 /DNA_ID=CAMNT_0010681065 /DNA_START=49 /DNA_END=343 /DNA_ORIENTATION=+
MWPFHVQANTAESVGCAQAPGLAASRGPAGDVKVVADIFDRELTRIPPAFGELRRLTEAQPAPRPSACRARRAHQSAAPAGNGDRNFGEAIGGHRRQH